jgi:streptogramin lyase
MKKTILLFLFSLIIANSFAQINQIALGNWRFHIPYNKGIQVAEDYAGKIYCAAEFGLFSYNSNNGEYEYYSTLNGLSDHELNLIAYDRQTKILMITYENSNIDMILPDKSIVNLPDIKQKNIVGGKGINSITFINGYAYLGCEFGIVVLDINRQEVKDTYYIGANSTTVNVQGVALNGTTLLAATDGGVYTADINNPTIFNSTAWTKDLTLVEPNANYSSAAMVSNEFYVVKTSTQNNSDSVLFLHNGSWQLFCTETGNASHIEEHNGYLIYSNWSEVIAYDPTGAQVIGLNIYNAPNILPKRGLVDANGKLWIADYFNGLILAVRNSPLEYFTPNGPGAESVARMESMNGKLWVASGSVAGDVPFYGIRNGIYRFIDEQWKSFNTFNDSIYRLANQTSPAVGDVAIDPNDDNHVYATCFGAGVMEYYNDKGIAYYNARNANLGFVGNDSTDLRIGGVTFDEDGNLWAVTGYTTRCVSVRRTDGGWFTYNLPDPNLTTIVNFDPIVDDYGQKWFVAHKGASNGAGVYVLKEASLTSNAGLKIKALTTQSGQGNLPDLFVRSIAKDKDGAIWLGTNQGVAVIYNPGNVFDGGNFDAQKVILEQDGYAQYLLETENVTSVAIDPANRKWFGTANGGAFLMSADGTKQLLNFNMENSPLPSNLVNDIAVDEKTGEVFFGTEKGLISYQGDATAGSDSSCTDFVVYPNPVQHDYNGPIAIRGVVNNADVKITDVAGNVVYHTKANGGLATWNGMNYKGERAQTGVYIVYVSNEDGTQTCLSKILFSR